MRWKVISLAITIFLSGNMIGAEDRKIGKLLEIGWDTPDVPFLIGNIKGMEQKPFDGVVIDIGRRNGRTRAEAKDGLLASFWQSTPIGEDLRHRIQEDIALLANAKFERMDHNFIEIWAYPGGLDLDWFDDAQFRNILNNWRFVAKVVKQIGFRGIFFDNEYYAKRRGPRWRPCVWRYVAQPQHNEHSFADYQQKAYERGREIMRIIRQENPGIVILLTFGHSLLANDDPATLKTHWYGLLPAFLDGWLAEAGKDVTIVDGYENAYGFRQRRQFSDARDLVLSTSARTSQTPDLYRKRMRNGFGLFVDAFDKSTWHVEPATFDENDYTPAELEEAVRSALGLGAYVWIYSHKINWWTGEFCPKEYLQALTRAKQPRENWGRSLNSE
jgi:hypothetical protein